MSTRKRKADDEELVALPSDSEGEEEEEYVVPILSPSFPSFIHRAPIDAWSVSIGFCATSR